MKKLLISLAFTSFISLSVFSQIQIDSTGNVGIGTTTPDASAALDVTSTEKGFLPPRMTALQMAAVAALPTPAEGLIVYCLDCTPKGVYYYDGNKFVSFNAWSLLGNSGIVDSVNFIGTTDDVPFNIRVNNEKAGRIDNTLNNTFFGYQSGNSNTTGVGNTANGSFALYLNDTGIRNTANGFSALYFNTTGSYNSANGGLTLSSNTTGHNNTANGYFALFSNTTGFYNTANGSEALYDNTIGNWNTANGYRALYSNEGYGNTANGASALSANTTGNNNTANGRAALNANTTGNNNTANGYFALVGNTTGHSNTANGSAALYFNTGEENTATGHNALFYNTTGIRNTAIGFEALFDNTTGNYNTASGYRALYNKATGNWNTAFGRQALFNLISGTNNIGIGYDAQVPSNTGSNQIRLGNSSISYAGVQVGWTVPSDKRWKESIRELPYGLAFVTQLQPVDYIRKNNEHKTRETGFIAQDVEALLIKEGYTDQGFLTKDDNGYFGIRYNDFFALLTKAIQEQQEIIEEQNAKIEVLQIANPSNIDVSQLMQRIEDLEANLNNQ